MLCYIAVSAATNKRPTCVNRLGGLVIMSQRNLRFFPLMKIVFNLLLNTDNRHTKSRVESYGKYAASSMT